MNFTMNVTWQEETTIQSKPLMSVSFKCYWNLATGKAYTLYKSSPAVFVVCIIELATDKVYTCHLLSCL